MFASNARLLPLRAYLDTSLSGACAPWGQIWGQWVGWRSRGHVYDREILTPVCGGAGIRTQGDPKASAVFKTAAFDRSATPPMQ